VNPITKIATLLKSSKIQVILDQMICSGSNFVTTILLARQLGIQEFGIYASVILVLYLFLSVSNALIVAPFQVQQAKESDQSTYISSLFIWQIIICLLFILLIFAVSIAHIHAVQSLQAYVTLIVFLIITFLLQDFFRKVFIAVGKLKEALYIDIITNFSQLIWLASSAYKHTLNLSQSLFIMAITFIPSIIAGLIYLKPVIPAFSKFINHGKQLIISGKWLLLTAMVQWWSNNFFVVASGLFISISALGALRLAQTLFGVLNVFLQVYENYLLPAASRLFIQSSLHLKQYLRKSTLKSLILLIPVSICIIVLAKPIFRLSGGSAYVDYAFVLQGMVILYLFIFIGYPIRMAIRVMMLNREFFFAYMITLVFSLIASRFLIREMGLAGVITGLIINQLLVLTYWQFILIRKKFVLWH